MSIGVEWDQERNFSGLEAVSPVSPPWPLIIKGMYYFAFIGPENWSTPKDSPPTFPTCYVGLETFVFHHVDPLSLFYYPEGGARTLRSLTVVGDANGTFAHTVACNPRLLDTLCSDNLSVRRFLARVQLQGALTHLELAFLYDASHYLVPVATARRRPNLLPYLGLYNHFPSSLRSRSFRGPPDAYMFDDLYKWIAKANDPLWLPDLREFAFVLAPEVFPGEEMKDEETDASLQVEQAQIDSKIAELLSALK